MTRRMLRTALLLGVVALLAGAGPALAEDDATSLGYISYLERYATVRPGQGGESLDAQVNMPVLAGDRLETARGARVELQLPEGATVWVDEFSTLDFDAIAFSRDDDARRTVLFLAEGSAAVEIPQEVQGEGTIMLDSPSGAVYFSQPGIYRVDLTGEQLHVITHAGLAELPEGEGSALLRAGQEAWVAGDGYVQKARLETRGDDFWRWVEERRSPAPSGQTARYVDGRYGARAGILDAYGDWVYASTYSSWMWRPRVAVGWSPYTQGRWHWTPVGWTWVSYEPWGWYPYHYGSWYWDASFGWGWCWDQVWSPAWVHWIYTPGYVGWAPRGYYDWWYWNNHGGHGGRGHFPDRWRHATLDLHGRVHLGRIDPRPWTFVSSRDFTSSRLERVRMDPERLLRGLPNGGQGFVRSGPLVTRERDLPERSIDAIFRAPRGREVPDLSGVLRREAPGRDGVRALPEIRTIETREVTRLRGPERRDGLPGLPGDEGRERGQVRAPSRTTGRLDTPREIERPPVSRPSRQPVEVGGSDRPRGVPDRGRIGEPRGGSERPKVAPRSDRSTPRSGSGSTSGTVSRPRPGGASSAPPAAPPPHTERAPVRPAPPAEPPPERRNSRTVDDRSRMSEDRPSVRTLPAPIVRHREPARPVDRGPGIVMPSHRPVERAVPRTQSAPSTVRAPRSVERPSTPAPKASAPSSSSGSGRSAPSRSAPAREHPKRGGKN